MTTKIVVFDIAKTRAVENPLLIYEVLEMLKDGQITAASTTPALCLSCPSALLCFELGSPASR